MDRVGDSGEPAQQHGIVEEGFGASEELERAAGDDAETLCLRGNKLRYAGQADLPDFLSGTRVHRSGGY
jgi:hypothetical protein